MIIRSSLFSSVGSLLPVRFISCYSDCNPERSFSAYPCTTMRSGIWGPLHGSSRTGSRRQSRDVLLWFRQGREPHAEGLLDHFEFSQAWTLALRHRRNNGIRGDIYSQYHVDPTVKPLRSGTNRFFPNATQPLFYSRMSECHGTLFNGIY